MGKSGQKFGKFSESRGKISGACALRAVAYLRAQHGAKAAEAVSAATGGYVSVDTARKWFAGVSAPSFFAFAALIAAYGPEFLHAVMETPPPWLDRAAREQALARIEMEQQALTARIAALKAGRA